MRCAIPKKARRKSVTMMDLDALRAEARKCRVCETSLPPPPRPVLQVRASATACHWSGAGTSRTCERNSLGRRLRRSAACMASGLARNVLRVWTDRHHSHGLLLSGKGKEPRRSTAFGMRSPLAPADTGDASRNSIDSADRRLRAGPLSVGSTPIELNADGDSVRRLAPTLFSTASSQSP